MDKKKMNEMNLDKVTGGVFGEDVQLTGGKKQLSAELEVEDGDEVIFGQKLGCKVKLAIVVELARVEGHKKIYRIVAITRLLNHVEKKSFFEGVIIGKEIAEGHKGFKLNPLFP